MNATDKIRKILIVQTAFIGDVILTLPLIQQSARLFPDAEIHFLTIPDSVPLVETHPDVHHVWVFRKKDVHKSPLALWRFASRLREEAFDLALVPHRSLRSALLVWLARIPLRIGFARSAGRWLFNSAIPYPTGVHEIERNLHLLAPFWVWEGEKIFPRLYVTRQDEMVALQWLAEQNLHPQKYIAMAPGSVWATKRWLPERFAALADRLIQQGYDVVLIGGAADQQVADEVIRSAEYPLHNAVGRFPLRQSAVLLREAALLVSNDSAPMHLAVAMNTPVVAIFGPTVPAFGFYPYGHRDRVVEDTSLVCRPCGMHGHQKCPLGTHACMKNVSINAVLRAVEEVFNVKTFTS